MRSDGVGGLFRGLSSLIGRDVPFNALFYGSYESCCAALMRAEGLKSKDDLGMSRIFFAGGPRGWLQTVPAPGWQQQGPRQLPIGPLAWERSLGRSDSAAGATRISPPQSALGLRLPTCRPTGLAGSFGWSFIMPCGRIANKRTAPTWRCRFGTLWLWVAIRTRGRGLAPT